MGPAKETAEEQLLRMIEGSAGPPAPSGPARRGAPGPGWLSRIRAGLGAVRGWTLPPQQQRAVTDIFLWRLRLTQRLFWLALVGFGGYVAIDLFLVERRLPTLAAPGAGPGGTGLTGGAPAADERIKPLSAYRETLVGRNPFGLTARETESATATQWVKDKLLELSSSLRVVGISRGKHPEAIIEDSAAARTYFVKLGEEINGLKITAIDEQGVLISYEGQEAYLK